MQLFNQIGPRKFTAYLLLLIPFIFISLFLFGETFSGDVSGIGHIFQLIPIILAALLVWKKPRLGGYLLIFGSILLGILYFMSAVNELPANSLILVGSLLFLAPLVSGLLLVSEK